MINPATGDEYSHNADERFALCSTFKTYAAARALEMAADHELSLEDSIEIRPEDIVENSVALDPKVETVMPLREVAAATLTHSDNTAGNILLKRIGGPSAVTAAAREFGDEQTRLDRWEPDLNDVGPGSCVTRRLPPRWLPAIRRCSSGVASSLRIARFSSAGCGHQRHVG